MRIAVVGSRDYKNLEDVKEYIRSLPPETVVISGGARGVDRTAAKEAREQGLKVIEILPDWDKYGKSAGYRRNILIVEEAEKVVAFWDGKSKGTEHTVRIAMDEGKDVEIKGIKNDKWI